MFTTAQRKSSPDARENGAQLAHRRAIYTLRRKKKIRFPFLFTENERRAIRRKPESMGKNKGKHKTRPHRAPKSKAGRRCCEMCSAHLSDRALDSHDWNDEAIRAFSVREAMCSPPPVSRGGQDSRWTPPGPRRVRVTSRPSNGPAERCFRGRYCSDFLRWFFVFVRSPIRRPSPQRHSNALICRGNIQSRVRYYETARRRRLFLLCFIVNTRV